MESMEKFLKKGQNVNKQDQRGITPLGIAVGFNRLPAVEFLLKNGADVHLTDGQGNTVLHYAAGNHPGSPINSAPNSVTVTSRLRSSGIG